MRDHDTACVCLSVSYWLIPQTSGWIQVKILLVYYGLAFELNLIWADRQRRLILEHTKMAMTVIFTDFKINPMVEKQRLMTKTHPWC